jgi:hypothetical protein
LSGLRAKTRKLINIAKGTGQLDIYKEAFNCYNKEIRKARLASWRGYCQISDIPGSARLKRIMAKQTTDQQSKHC